MDRGGSRRRKAWKRLGRFRGGLRSPEHPSREFHKVWLSRNLICELIQEVCRGSTRRSERGFWRVDGGKMVGKK